MQRALIFTGTLIVVALIGTRSEAQPIGNAPIITAPGAPAAVIQRFGDPNTTSNLGRLSTPKRPSGSGAIANTPASSGATVQPSEPSVIVGTPEQKPLVCQTLGHRTVCE